MELEEARKILKSYENKLVYEISEKDKETVVVVLNHLTKQEKMINKIIKHICEIIDNDDNASLLPFYNSDNNIEEKVKQYFEKEVEGNE